MIETWMLLRAITYLQRTFDVKWALFHLKDGLLYEVDRRLQIKAVIPSATRKSMWQAIQLEAFVGYASDNDFILIVRSKHHPQDTLKGLMWGIIPLEPNFTSEELLP